MKINKIILTGGSGFIANYLINFFLKKKEIKIIVFTRNKNNIGNVTDNIKYVEWDAKNINNVWIKELENTDLLINLTGKNIQCLFNKKNKKELLNSRIDSIKVLNKAIKFLKNPPKLWIQASSLSFYGSTTELCTELTKKGVGFLSDLIEEVENTLFEIKLYSTRKISLRFGLALHSSGGILKKLVMLTKYFLGSPIANKNIYISWFHLFDLIRVLKFLFYNDFLEGVFNFCSPYPVSNNFFMRELRSYFKKIYIFTIPSFMLNFILKNIINIDPCLILNLPQAIPKKLLDAGFEFNFLNLESVFLNLYSYK